MHLCILKVMLHHGKSLAYPNTNVDRRMREAFSNIYWFQRLISFQVNTAIYVEV